jgi:hypothetical protein
MGVRRKDGKFHAMDALPPADSRRSEKTHDHLRSLASARQAKSRISLK